MDKRNKLVLIGNGFDLAHGLKTSYKDFLNWYMCEAFQKFRINPPYKDSLIEIKNKYTGTITRFEQEPSTSEEVLNLISENDKQTISYLSKFFETLLSSFTTNNWIDIECYYFRLLKTHFSDPNLGTKKKDVVFRLNSEFDFLIAKLSNYIRTINNTLIDIPKLKIDSLNQDLYKVFAVSNKRNNIKFLNFNYTDTLIAKHYAKEDEIIHIHGRVTDIDRNSIIFGYGDETDPAYQNIEDSGENVYLEHIKSFGYFRTGNYHKLLSYIDSGPYVIYIIGHSCGLSDRVLLNEIFEHSNCEKIELFYYIKNDGSDNFKETTQEISRHFRPHNKNIMRRKVGDKNAKYIIPQNAY